MAQRHSNNTCQQHMLLSTCDTDILCDSNRHGSTCRRRIINFNVAFSVSTVRNVKSKTFASTPVAFVSMLATLVVASKVQTTWRQDTALPTATFICSTSSTRAPNKSLAPTLSSRRPGSRDRARDLRGSCTWFSRLGSAAASSPAIAAPF